MVGPRTRQSPCLNPPPAGEDELAGAVLEAPINDNSTFSYTPAESHVPTPAPAPLFAPGKLLAKYSDAVLQKATKLALELFVQGQQQAQSQMATPALEPREWPLKARFLDFYYCNSHIDCYQFCQQCKDHFKTAKAKGPNKIPFAALFLHGLVT